jgi:predicted restriction endonuclease
MEAYERRCAVTGTDVEQVLQAAHIVGYAESGDNALRNGLLLRADIHDLFDRGLLWISATSKMAVAPELGTSVYGKLHGKALHLPKDPLQRPDPKRLTKHRREIALRPR